MRFGLDNGFPQGCSKFGITRLDTEKPVGKPALVLPHALLPLFITNPARACCGTTGNGEIAVGWLCVSIFTKCAHLLDEHDIVHQDQETNARLSNLTAALSL